MKIGILGTGAFGLALSDILVNNKNEVIMWTKFKEEKELLEKQRKNEKLLPGFELNKEVTITNDIEKCINNSKILIIAIPVEFIGSLCDQMKQYINKDKIILIASKGIEQNSCYLIDEIIKNKINNNNIAVISGPSFAIDIISKKTIGFTIASKNKKNLNLITNVIKNEYINIEYSKDIKGVELCGAIKNIFAIAAGILDGKQVTDSTKAMYLTKVINNIETVLSKLKNKKETILTYSGVGDLILTCTSQKSRNYSLGKLIGESKDKKIVTNYLKENTVEGYYTLKSIKELLKRNNIENELINIIYKIVIENKSSELLIDYLNEN